MAGSVLKVACICALASAWGSATVAAQNSGSDRQELLLDSESFSFDNQSSLVRIRAPRITQGGLKIEADEAVATGLDFDASSEWRFSGRVRITVESAVMEADSAVFTFANEQLARGELIGNPATFNDSNTDGQFPISGSAGALSYDYVARTLRLTGNAWLRRDRTEVTGCDLIYDFAAERFRSGSAGCGEAYSFRVLPRPSDPAAETSPPE
jgi:lipopolysaccharide transport protein LptA